MGAASRDFLFGNPGDVPFADDVDGDGTADIGGYRPSTGMSYTRLSHTTGPADGVFPSTEPNALRGSFFSSG